MFKASVFSLIALFLVSCTDFVPKADVERFPEDGIVFSTPSVNSTFVQNPKNLKKICMGRGADALFETSESGDFSISLVSLGKGGDSAGETDNAGEEEMMGRTPAVLLAREMFYRACELTNNAQLDQEEAVKIFKSVLNVVEKGWGKESKNTTITIGDSLSTKNSVQNQVQSSPPKIAKGGAGADTSGGAGADTSGGAGADTSGGTQSPAVPYPGDAACSANSELAGC